MSVLEVTAEGDVLRVIYNGHVVIEHTQGEPFAWARKGRWKAAEEAVRDRAAEHAPLTRAECDRGLQVIRLSGGDFSLTFRLEERDGVLCLIPQRSTTGLNRLKLRFPARPGEPVYGAGAQYDRLNLRGMRVPLWVRDRRLYFADAPIPSVRIKGMRAHPSTFPMPVFFTGDFMWLSFECTAPVRFDFTAAREHVVELWELPACIAIGKESSYPDMMAGMTRFLGRQPILPHWMTDGACLEVSGGSHSVARNLERLEGAKITSLSFADWTGTRDSKEGPRPFFDWAWNRELYPRLDTLIKGLSARNVMSTACVAPHFSIEGRLYAEAATNGFLMKKPQGGHYISDIGGFMAGHLDLTNPSACTWFKTIIKDNILGLGFCGIEAAMGAYLPPDAILASGENPVKIRGRWPLMWAKIHREAIREAGRAGDSAFFSESGWIGSAKHAMVASTGDCHTGWSRTTGMQSSLTASLSLSCSGMGVSTGKSGGTVRFMGSRSKELLMRWCDFGAFTPVFRVAVGDGDGWQPHSDEETVEHFVRMSRAHYLLSPYTHDCVKENATTGMPVMRPLALQFPEDGQAAGAADSYMFGAELLVAPVFSRGRRNRKVHLPEGHWVDLWSGKTHGGGDLVCPAPLGRPPAFYRADGKHAELFGNFERRLRD